RLLLPGSSPAFAGLSSCHRHDEFAFGEPAAHPPPLRQAQEGGDNAGIGLAANHRHWRVAGTTVQGAYLPPLRGRKRILGFGEAKPLEFARGGIILPQTLPPEHEF